MKAMVLEKFREPMVLRDVSKPSIGLEDILLRVKACGLCGTDIKIYDGEVKTVKLPHIPGHELAGEVAELGAGVEGWRVGDHGVVHIYIPCGNCYQCRQGRENDCASKIERIGFEDDGGFGEYVRIPARNLCKISQDIPLEQACILSGSIATPLHGIRTQGRIQMGETVVIVGLGGLGIHALQLAVVMGARVIAVDISEEKLKAAHNFGAEGTINSSERDFVSEILRLTDREGADLIVESVGGSQIPTILEQSIQALRLCGRLVLLGYQYGQLFSLDPQKIVYDELEIIGARASVRQDLVDVISLVERGKIRPVISECFPLEQANEAFVKLRRSTRLGRMILTL
ncbi:alcohol dehydrogenase catalytic domain-containing protein [Chloroflexota bacterium]